MPRKIEISHKTIVFTVVFLGLVWFLYLIRDVLFQVFLALVIMSILNPMVTKLHRWKIPRAASVLIVYITLFVVIGVLIARMTPLLVEQTTSFANNITGLIESSPLPGEITEQVTNELASQLGSVPASLVRFGVSVFSNLLAVFTVLFFALYFLLARENLDENLGQLLRNEGPRALFFA